MVTNNFQWPSKRATHRKVINSKGIDVLSILSNQVATLSKKLDAFWYQNSIAQPLSLENQGRGEPRITTEWKIGTIKILNFKNQNFYLIMCNKFKTKKKIYP